MVKKEKLSALEFALIGLGASQGAAFLVLPNAVIEIAKQDSWISAIIGLIYPLYVILISLYIIKKHPNENILMLSKRYLGNFFGNILNFILMLQFIIITAGVTGEFVNLSRVYIVNFLVPQKIILIGILLAAYCSFKGIKVIGRMNKIIIYAYLAMLFSLVALKYGSILNIKPIFGAGTKNILKGSVETAFSYYGWEALLLFHPLVHDKKAIKKSVLKFFMIGAIVYVWITFITVYFLGVDILPKTFWSTVFVFESLRTKMINNFRFVFMIAWLVIVLRTMTIYYFSSIFQINYFSKINLKKLSILVFPLFIYISIKFADSILRTDVLNLVTPIFVIINISWITLIAILSKLIRKNKQIEKIDKEKLYKKGIVI